MRKALTFLSASLCIGFVAPARAQDTPFPDNDKNHWAYEAVEHLHKLGIVIGYPDGNYRGKRTMTRYEFAVALDRWLKKIPQPPAGPPGQAGPPGERGEMGEVGPPGMVPEDFARLRKLFQEFRQELIKLGNDERSINARLGGMEKDVANIKDELRKRPVVFGASWIGGRFDQATHPYMDRDGHILSAGPYPTDSDNRITNPPQILHFFGLGIRANIPGGAKFETVITNTNTIGAFGGNLAKVGHVFNPGPSDTYVHHLTITTPFGALRNGGVTLGRFGEKISPLTFQRPWTNTYFDDPYGYDGYYYSDGGRITANFGSVRTEVFGSQFSSVRGVNSYSGSSFGWNTPCAGTDRNGTFLFGTNNTIMTGMPDQGQIRIDQMIGATATLGLGGRLGGQSRSDTPVRTASLNPMAMGGMGGKGYDGSGGGGGSYVRLVALNGAQRNTSYSYTPPGGGNYYYTSVPNQAAVATGQFSSVMTLGADTKLKFGPVSFSGDWAKTITQRGRFTTVNPHQDNAFTAMFGLNAGPVKVDAGYRYIDPLFYSSGYWGRIGNWINPTNVQGPMFNAGVNVMHNVGLNFGGEYSTAARSRNNVGGLGRDDSIYRALIGLKWDVAKNFQVTSDWEGDYWTLKGQHSGGLVMPVGAGAVHPTTHYVTVGTGYHLTDQTMLRLTWQTGAFDGHNLLGGGPNIARQYNFNAIVGQVGVRY